MASWWQKSLLAAAGLAGLTVGSYYTLTQRPLPQKSGRLYLAGLHESVEIITDRYGIPHIYARNEDDLYFAQGYMHAQDRLWQLEMNRRLGSGRLSEIFGEIALETDRFCRRLGMHRSAAEEVERLSSHNKRVLEAYARGINTFVTNNSHRLPIEFTLLRFRPAPWKVADTLQWGKMMGWNLGGNWETELIRARLIAKLGAERASQLEAGYDSAHPLIIPPGVAYQGINSGLLEQYHQIQDLSGFSMFGGSNNWVVDGTMTTTGSPILCNDPHLGQAIPSIWYECHLVAGDIDVVGASFAGSPGIIIGHNQEIAWGVTNAVSDVQDLYIEKFHPDDPNLYEFQGQWLEATLIREEIAVKGRKAPAIEEVRVTRHGPILTNISAQSTELPLALRWTGLESSKIISSVQKLNRASNWYEFRDALRDWDVPAQNFVYADNSGNIGYIMAGAIPVRAKGQALLPSPGWTGEYEWTGLIPFDELPQTYNPTQHFIVTANNRVVDDDYPYYITNEWLNGYRAQRIRDLLTTKGKLSPQDMALIQSDQYSLPAEAIVPFLLKVEPRTALERQAQNVLRVWDHVLAPESVGACLYSLCLRKLEIIVLGTMFGDDDSLLKNYLGVGATILANSNGYFSRSTPLLIRLLQAQDETWFAQSAIANGPHTWQEALQMVFQGAVSELQERFGNDILSWQYGRIHRMTYSHPLGSLKVFEKFFNRGPYPTGGDTDTVNMGAALPNNPEVVTTVPSFRQIVDLAHLENSLSVHAPGQSGQPTSPHFDDFIPLWRSVHYHPMLF
ncbi:MAG TPA: penicillin acylase family protein, partial [Ktedonobacteraceae bacterium]